MRYRKEDLVSFAETIKPPWKFFKWNRGGTQVAENQAVKADSLHPGLTPRRILKILTYAYKLTRENRMQMLKGFVISAVWAGVGILFGLPMKYLVDCATEQDPLKRLPMSDYVPITIVAIIVSRALHNILLPYFINKRRTRLMIADKKALSVNAAVNIDNIDRAKLKQLLAVAGKNLQAWLQVSREEIANLKMTAVFDAPLYIRGIGMNLYFAWLALEAPWFAFVSLFGIAIYGAITVSIGIKLGRLFREKQSAFMALQEEEQQVFNDLLRSRNFSMFNLLFMRRSSVDTDQFAGAWDDFEKKFLDSEIRLLRYNMLVRDVVLEVTKIAALCVALWYGSIGMMQFGTAFYLVDQIDKAADPFALFGPLQKMLLNAELFIESHMAISCENDRAET
ncbi:hypothetical protein HZC00_03155 [Candidatus Kaiserbacteria bacterium]|nr:hypothetical protein [Candidatus Kaiserbacteria bacterium]